jgi:hypothetical protein
VWWIVVARPKKRFRCKIGIHNWKPVAERLPRGTLYRYRFCPAEKIEDGSTGGHVPEAW